MVPYVVSFLFEGGTLIIIGLTLGNFSNSMQFLQYRKSGSWSWSHPSSMTYYRLSTPLGLKHCLAQRTEGRYSTKVSSVPDVLQAPTQRQNQQYQDNKT
jgi:hypothetical protein